MRKREASALASSTKVAALRRCALGAFLLASLARAGPPEAAPGDYLIDFWDAEKGLPANSVTAIAQTPEGYLWLGTYNGLVRFDGVRFVTFDPRNTPHLKHARVERLFVDAAGTLFVNTHDGSLTSWRRGVFSLELPGQSRLETGVWMLSSRAGEQLFLLETGAVIRRELHDGRPGSWQTIHPAGATFRPTYCATESGAVWIVSSDQRLWRIAGGHSESMRTLDGLDGRVIQCLGRDPADRVWVGTEREIAVWDGLRFQRMTPENAEPRLNVTFILFTRDGAYWAAANNRMRKARGRRWIAELASARHLATAAWPVLTGHEDRHGGIWFAHDGGGLLHVRRDGTPRRFTLADGFTSERVKSMLEDREGNVWVSVDRGGLARLRVRRFQWLAAAERGAPHAAVSVSQDRHGSIWIGTLGGGLTRWRDGIVKRFPLPRPASRQFVFSVFPDARDRLWLSADFENLWIMERDRLRPAPWPLHGIKAILADRRGRVWMGRKNGLSCWMQGRLQGFAATDGIDETDVRALAEDGRGAVWIGSGDGTIRRFRDGAFERFRATDADAIQPIWSLLADDDGTAWAGTYRAGLLRLKDGRFTRYTTRDGLTSDDVCQIVDDEQGNLWLGSREGISRISKAVLTDFAQGARTTLTASTYGRSDGLPPLECSGYQPAAWRARDGTLLFATIRGVVSIQPNTLIENRVPPTVMIEEVWVDREPQNLSQRPGSHAGATLVIGPGKRHVEFRFTGLSLSAPEKVRFRYRLEGLERDWIEAGPKRTSQYSYLRPRDYRFHVIACNNDGVWNEEGASLTIRLLPHFWETWWFLSLLGLTTMGLVAGGARHVATRRLRRDMERLERQRAIESDRARIAKDIHDDLGAGLTQISLLSELARSDRHTEADEHLEQISTTACELTRTMDEIVWAVNPANDTLDGLWSYLSQFAQDYLGLAGIQCRLQAPDPLPPLPLSAEVRHNVFLAFKEALNNVVKHARAHEVRVGLEPKASSFALVIQDDGRGFEPGVPDGGPLTTRSSSGQGLGNMTQRMLSIGGRCDIHSERDRGSRIVLTVALL